MANYNNWVSNPCFHSLQAPVNARNLPQTKSVILYANKFSGLDVPMDAELRELFGSNEMNLTDINIRSQIAHLLDQFDSKNGPWYIDGINGTLHIHNRRIANPSFVYRYQDENGEVLKVQIVTNWTTGSTSGTVASAITPDKNFDTIQYSNVKLDFTASQDDVDVKLPLGRILLTQDQVGSNNNQQDFQYHLYGPDGQDLGYGNSQKKSDVERNGGYGKPISWADKIQNMTITPGNIIESLNKVQKKVESDLQDDIENLKDIQKAQEKATAYLEKSFSEWAVDPDNVDAKVFDTMRKEILAAIQDSNIEMNRKYIEEGFNYGVKYGSLEGLPKDLQTLFSNPLNGSKWNNILPTIRTVETFSAEGTEGGYDSYGTNNQVLDRGTTTNVMPSMESKEWVSIGSTPQEGQKWLQDNGFVTISKYNVPYSGESIKETTYNKALDELMQRAINRALSSSKTPNATIGKIEFRINRAGNPEFRVTASGEYVPVVPAFTYMNYLYTRDKPGGGSKKAKLQAYINSMMNRSKKAKHKEIEVQMIVIGRPLLSSGQYVYIGNIGNKYSGNWYIKTCIHQMDSNGYTCSLTLKKNNNKSDGAAMTVNKSRGKQVEVGGLIPFSWPKDGIEETIWITPIDKNVLDARAAMGDKEGVWSDVLGIMKQKEIGEYGPGKGRYEMVGNRTIESDRSNSDVKSTIGVGFKQSEEGKRVNQLLTKDLNNAKEASQKANSNLSKPQ